MTMIQGKWSIEKSKMLYHRYQDPQILEEMYKLKIARHGKPRWYKPTWIDWWLTNHALLPYCGFWTAIMFAKDFCKWALGWLIVLLPIVALLMIGALFGHFIWR